jgi:hypothetical protein
MQVMRHTVIQRRLVTGHFAVVRYSNNNGAIHPVEIVRLQINVSGFKIV